MNQKALSIVEMTITGMRTGLGGLVARRRVLGAQGVSINLPGQQAITLFDDGIDNDIDSDEPHTLRPLQVAACTYRIALGPRAGQKVLTVQGAMPRETGFKQDLCADIDGFSLHAAVRCGAGDRQALEQLCRYITRPALANERVQCNAVGQVVLKLKTSWHDGTTHLVMSPLEFIQRLAALFHSRVGNLRLECPYSDR